MVWYSSSPNSFDASAADQPLASICGARAAITSFFRAPMASRRASLSVTLKASTRRVPTAAFSAATRASLRTGAVQVPQSFLPAAATSSLIALMTVRPALWPKVTAPSITSSESSLASDSTISTALAVPATTSSSSEVFSWVAVGLRMYWPLA